MIVIPVLVVCALVIICSKIVIIKEGYVSVRAAFGQFSRVCTAGMHVMLPFVHSMVSIKYTVYENGVARQVRNTMIATTVKELDPPLWQFMSDDGIALDVDVTVFYRVVDARKLAFVATDFTKLLVEEVRAKLASYFLTRTHDAARTGLRAFIDKQLAGQQMDTGVTIHSVIVQSVKLPESLRAVNERAYTLERELAVEEKALRRRGELARERAKLEALTVAEYTGCDKDFVVRMRYVQALATAAEHGTLHVYVPRDIGSGGQ